MRPLWLTPSLLVMLAAPQCQSAPASSGPDPSIPPETPQEPPLPPPPPPSDSDESRVVPVRSQAELLAAIREARPGDEIRLADGVYTGGVVITRSGVASNPVTLKGGRQAVIDAGNRSRSALLLKAEHWVIHGIGVTNGLFGVYLDGGNHNVLDSLEVSQVGQEGVTFANFSSDNVVRNSYIHDTGLSVAEWGEGVYIGTSVDNWDRVTGGRADQSDRNQVLNNVIGPNVRAEHVDVKEGTTGGIIRGNRFNGAGMVQSRFWVDSWMEIKGNDYQILENEGTDAITDGFQVISVVGGWGNGNVLRRNIADVQAPGFGIRIASGSGNLVGCDNVVTAAGAGFASVSCKD